jgi:hypothetical protein
VLASKNTRLAGLSDIVAVRPLHAVYSIGDFLLLAGISTLIAAGMRGDFDIREESHFHRPPFGPVERA